MTGETVTIAELRAQIQDELARSRERLAQAWATVAIERARQRNLLAELRELDNDAASELVDST